ncbi:MAG: hypothetical protein ACK53Y_14670, partial [bacterium]
MRGTGPYPYIHQILMYYTLYAIRRNIQSSLISWSPTHVKGHQDEQVAVSDLPRLAQLNCEMDALAKRTLW